MLFSRDKDDDDDFVPNPNYCSNLATIFGNSSGDGNSSLTYTAPKQPKPQNKANTRSMPSTSSSSNRVIIAKTVQTFKMMEGKYQAQGRLGAAVISIHSDGGPAYQLLLYRDKHHQICIARITREFSFHIQPKNYCTFYDKQNVIWSILFESAVELMEFAFEVALARWKAGEPTTPLMVQDLWCPISANVPSDSKMVVAASGDSIEVTYTLHPVTNINQGVEESHSICVVVQGSGWTQGLVGAQPTGHRVVILQPFMLGDLNPREVMYNCPVAVKITVIQVNKPPSREIPTDPPEEEIQNCAAKESPKPQQPPESVGGSPKPTKADLITRMARMGQALPFKATAPSDSDETEEDQSGRVRPSEREVPKPRSRMRHTTAVAMPQSQAPAPLQPLTPASGPVTQQWAAPPYMVGNAYAVAPQLQSPITMDSQFNMYLSEVRTTNSELRMGLTRLTDKVDNLHTKIERSGRKGDNEVLEQILENEQQMKQQLQLVLSAIQLNQTTRSSVDSILQGSASTMATVNNVFNQSSTETHQLPAELLERIKKLEEENEYLQTTVNAQKDALQNAKIADKDQLSRIVELQSQLEAEQQKLIELNQRVQNIELENDNLKDNLIATKKTISELQTTLQEKQTSIDKLEQALKDSEATHLDEVRRNLQEVLDPKPVIGEHVKKILNAVYRLVKVQFEPQSKYEMAFILSVLAETIKAVTIEYLQNGDLVNSEIQQTTFGTKKPIGQTHSAPAVSSEELSNAGETSALAGQYVRRDQRGLAEGEARTAPESGALDQSTSVSAAPLPVSADHNNMDDNHVDVNPLGANQNQPNLTGNTGKSKTEPSPSLADSSDDTSDNVWRPQPPPPPLFEDEENEDDWLN